MSERITAVTQEHGEIVTDAPDVDLHREWLTECDLRQEAQRIATEATARADAAEAALAEYRAKVETHVGRRREFVAALKASSTANEDYYRWSGHAEARRHLCADLGGPCICGHHTDAAKPVKP